MKKLYLVICVMCLWLGTIPAFAQINPPFNQCPAVGADTSCAILIVVTDKAINVYTDPTQGPYDQIEDTLVGVLNNSSGIVYSLPLNSPNPIFGFDGDGICGTDPNTGMPFFPAPPGCPYGTTCPGGSTGYEGPGVCFGSINGAQTSGVVNLALGPGESTYFSLELAISTICPTLSGQPIMAPLLKQASGYPRVWGGSTYDNYRSGDPHTMKRSGCAVTSSAMLINYFGAMQTPAASTDPGKLNTWLAQNHGFDSGHNIRWNSVATYANSQLQIPLAYQGAGSANDFVVDNYLCAQTPVILQVTSPSGNTHFVLSTGGESTSDGDSTYFINDPGFSCTTLDQSACSYDNEYGGIRPFSYGPNVPQSGLEIDADAPPLDLLVTAPSGQQTGYDSSTGKTIQQIPASSYYTESIGDDEGGNLDTPETKKIEIGTPADGQYTLDVIGNGSGNFTLDFAGYDTTGAITVQTMTGSIVAGQIYKYGITYSSTAGSQIMVTAETPVTPPIPPDFSVSANPSSATLEGGGPATYALSLTPINGFNQAILLSCSGAPAGTVCSISPASVTLDGSNAASATVYVSIAPGYFAGLLFNLHKGGSAVACVFLMPPMFGLLLMRRKKLAMSVATVALLGLTIACGGGANHSLKPGQYPLQVQASSGQTSHTVQLTLNIAQ